MLQSVMKQLQDGGMGVNSPSEAMRAVQNVRGGEGESELHMHAQSMSQLSTNFDAKQSVAFSATRLPGVYAGLVRIFDELQFRLPAFKPTRVLDYASGPGTAMWALQKVCGTVDLFFRTT